jgi:transcriptional regulator with XRE-family HTH domain
VSETLGETIREAREAVGGLRECAARLDISPCYLCDIELDRCVPSEDVLEAIARLTGLDLALLLAMAGRFGDVADRYLKREPLVGELIRRIAKAQLSRTDIGRLIQYAAELEMIQVIARASVNKPDCRVPGRD